MARDGSGCARVVSSDAPESPTFVGNQTVPVRALLLVQVGSWGSLAVLVLRVRWELEAERFDISQH